MPSTTTQALHFSSSMDKGTKRKTLFVFLLFASVFGLMIVFAIDEPVMIILPAFLALIYAGIMSYGIYETPVRYTISDDTFSIVSRWNSINIPLSDIKEVSIFNEEDRKGCRKNMGADGVLGNIGSYSSRLHKEMSLYTSRDTNWMLITKKNGRKLVVSPDDLALVDELNKRLA